MLLDDKDHVDSLEFVLTKLLELLKRKRIPTTFCMVYVIYAVQSLICFIKIQYVLTII
jgi:hypothetical protein